MDLYGCSFELIFPNCLQLFSKYSSGFPNFLIRSEIDKYIRLSELDAFIESSKLSSSKQRKLAVCIALCGESKVVFLDEPTSGVESCARRLIWDMLVQEKYDRTIVMSTFCMDEADLLGDRIAILANGRIQCCGSPSFLYQRFASGYRLVCTKGPFCDEGQVTAFLLNYFQIVTVEKNIGTDLTYLLADEGAAEQFAPMFDQLERSVEQLGIQEFVLFTTRLEAIYKQVGMDSTHLATYMDELAGVETRTKPESE